MTDATDNEVFMVDGKVVSEQRYNQLSKRITNKCEKLHRKYKWPRHFGYFDIIKNRMVFGILLGELKGGE